MAFTNKTIKAEELLAALEKSASDTLTFEKKKVPEGKKYKCEYFNTFIQTDPSDKPYNPSIYFRDGFIIAGPPDPNSPDAQENNGTTVSLKCSGINSGAYGKLIKLFDAERVRKLSADEYNLADMKFCPMYTEKYSRKAKKEYAGKSFPNPKNKEENDWRFMLTLDFGTYPTNDKIPEHMRGKPKTIIKDFRTGRINETTGQIEYDLLTVDGQPIDLTNAHKAFGHGSIIEEGYVSMSSTSVSQFGVSTRQTAIELVITPAAPSDFGKLETVDNSALLDKIRKLQEAKEAAEKELAETKAEAAAPAAPSLDAIEEHIDEGLAESTPDLADDIAGALEDI